MNVLDTVCDIDDENLKKVTEQYPGVKVTKDFHDIINNENITEYNDSVKDLKELFENSVNSLILVDTSNINMNDLSIKVACEVMNVMRSKYIESFKKKYKL